MTTPDEPRFATERIESPSTGMGTETGTGTPGVA
jgi:hypothetical protein